MSLPKQTPRRVLIKKFRALSWNGPVYGTKHHFMEKGKHKVRIPNPHGSDIGIELLKLILNQANISEEEWEKA